MIKQRHQIKSIKQQCLIARIAKDRQDCFLKKKKHSVEAKNILSLQFIRVVGKLSKTVARCLHVYHSEAALQAT